MRIGGYGSGGLPQNRARDRAASFRARHSIGQRIMGRILRREANGLYWVLAGGEELLARLEVQAEPGDELVFLVRALTPEIMLQALPGGAGAADLPGLVQRFRAARELFEVQDAELFVPLRGVAPLPALRAEAFEQAMLARPAAAERSAEVSRLLGQVNSCLDPADGRQAAYEPWLLPGARRMEILRGAGSGLRLSASAQDAGCFEVNLMLQGESPRLVVQAERPEACGALLVELAALVRSDSATEPTVLGPTRLRGNALGGVLGDLFGPVPAWTSGGLNTRV